MAPRARASELRASNETKRGGRAGERAVDRVCFGSDDDTPAAPEPPEAEKRDDNREVGLRGDRSELSGRGGALYAYAKTAQVFTGRFCNSAVMARSN